MKLNTLLAEIAQTTPVVLVETTVNKDFNRFSQNRVEDLLAVLAPYADVLNKTVEILRSRANGDTTVDLFEETPAQSVTSRSESVPVTVPITMSNFIDETGRYRIYTKANTGAKVFIPKFALINEVAQADGTISVTVTRRFLEETQQPELQNALAN